MNIQRATDHSYISVRKNAFFLDWRTQPSTFKTYPKFCYRYNIEEHEALKDIDLIGTITYKQQVHDGSFYTLRTQPSAGALYPCEIYLQIRGIKGILSGVYHYDQKEKNIVLLHEIQNDGIEYFFTQNQKYSGINFLISAVPFRSSWKYNDRAIRYILLDSGHQLGAIYAYNVYQGIENSVLFDFDKLTLNQQFGFRADEVFTVGLIPITKTQKEATKIPKEFFYASPCDYLEGNDFIYESYTQTAIKSTNESLPNFFAKTSQKELKDTILKRRSIRAFKKESITQEEFEFIIDGLFEFAQNVEIELFYVVHNVPSLVSGIYDNDGLIEANDYKEKCKYLALEQNIGGDAAVIFFFTAPSNIDFQKNYIMAGFIAHIIYLKATLKNIGTSGIGAYYDDEVKKFLGTPNDILYLLAIGR